jgi:hypothetical protein
MALWYVPNRGYVSDEDEDIPEYGEMTMPSGEVLSWGDREVRRLPEYTLAYQFPSQEGSPSSFQWEPGAPLPEMAYTPPGYLQQLLQFAEQAEAGTLKDYERWQWEEMKAQAMAVPTRDLARLTSAAQGGTWGGVPEDADSAWYLTQNSPDLGAIMLGLRDKVRAGTATDQERTLFEDVRKADAYQNWVASTPQPSDVFNPLGDQLFGALAILGTGATAGLAAAPLAAGTAGLATTLGSLGTLAGTAGGWASTIGGATGQGWLEKAGKALGIAGAVSGGLGGLTGLLDTGVRTVGDAARLASGTSKLLGAAGTAADSPALRQASRYLGLAGNVGRAAGGVEGLLSRAQEATQAGTQAAQAATEGGPMADFSYKDFLGWGDPYGPGTGDYFSPEDYDVSPEAYAAFTSWDDPTGPGTTGDTSTNWLNSILGSLGPAAGAIKTFLGSKEGAPLLSALGQVAQGTLGAGAAKTAAGQQSQALNRALDLQEAQWLQQQARTEPWYQAGRQALPQLQQLAGQGAPAPFEAGRAIEGWRYNAGLPSTAPGWAPSTYAGYTPTDIPSAAQYRYTPGGVPSAAQYRYTPGAVPTLSGQELLANDPGYQFRMDEARKQLEQSAAVRGGLASGGTLQALTRDMSQMASQEYHNAWQRASQQAQLREQWNQMASQMGWSQAESETRLREVLAQQASSQNWGQAAQEAQLRAQQGQFGWQAGFQAQQQGQRERQAYDTDLYNRMLQQNQLVYGRDVAQNQTDYERELQAYNSRTNAANTQWNRWASLAGLGPQATQQLGQFGAEAARQQTSLLGQLGTTQALGTLGAGNAWANQIPGLVGNAGTLLKSLTL